VTLADLALTLAVLGLLGVAASRFGLSAIPAYLLAGLLLGPNEPRVLSLIEISAVTTFLSELGVIFLLFFLGLEFTVQRLQRSGRHLTLGGAADLAVNLTLGLLVGFAAFGPSFAALIVAGAIYVSSSAVIVKGLIDFRRLADDETDLILAVLVFEDIVIAGFLGFAAAGGDGVSPTLVAVAKALAFITAALVASRYLARPIDRMLDALPREFFLIFTTALVIGMSATAKVLGMSEAIGALMAGVVLAETSVRGEIEDRFLAFRDVFAALFFFVFGLAIDVSALREVGWLVALAVAVSLLGKAGTGFAAGSVARLTPRQSLNVGAALVAHGEFTIILAEVASRNEAIASGDRADIVAFAGLYVLATATLGVVLMKESKRMGRLLFPSAYTDRRADAG
jgi:monovalent cation:H+ antiporter-2, CPA2 family